MVFKDSGVLDEETVHLHLEQRIAQRLLARFRSQGFIHHDLSRSCLVQSGDSLPRVILLGRLSLFGRGAERLHEEVITLSAVWSDPSLRQGKLKPQEREEERVSLDLLEKALTEAGQHLPTAVVRERLLASVGRDIPELLPRLEARARKMAEKAAEKLQERGNREEKELRQVLETQRRRVEAELEQHRANFKQRTFGFVDEEVRELLANMKAWEVRLAQFDRDLRTEPTRVREFYRVVSRRVEPIGIVYLWPETN